MLGRRQATCERCDIEIDEKLRFMGGRRERAHKSCGIGEPLKCLGLALGASPTKKDISSATVRTPQDQQEALAVALVTLISD